MPAPTANILRPRSSPSTTPRFSWAMSPWHRLPGTHLTWYKYMLGATAAELDSDIKRSDWKIQIPGLLESSQNLVLQISQHDVSSFPFKSTQRVASAVVWRYGTMRPHFQKAFQIYECYCCQGSGRTFKGRSRSLPSVCRTIMSVDRAMLLSVRLCTNSISQYTTVTPTRIT